MNKNKIWKSTFLTIFLICEVSSAEYRGGSGIQQLSGVKKQPSAILNISYPVSADRYYLLWDQYFIELLTLALSKVDKPYKLESKHIESHSEERAIQLLEQGAINIHWLHTSVLKEQIMLPIRIPLFKGLIGWRLLLIRKSKVSQFKNISSLEQLKQLNALQGISWPDTSILEENGLRIVTSRNVSTLFRMLKHGRGDYFPRSVIEIWRELNDYPVAGIVVEENLVIKYPSAYYFFVAKKDIQIKYLVEKGLNTAIADGSFDQLFMQYFGNIIEKSNLPDRNILTLNNSNIPVETPLSRKELWFSIPKKIESSIY